MNQVGRNVLRRLLNLIMTAEPIIIAYSDLINYCHLQSALHWPFLAQGPSKATWGMVFSIFYMTFEWSEADDKRVEMQKCHSELHRQMQREKTLRYSRFILYAHYNFTRADRKELVSLYCVGLVCLCVLVCACDSWAGKCVCVNFAFESLVHYFHFGDFLLCCAFR